MKLIPLTRGLFAQVDDEDYDCLNQWKWHITTSGDICYATRSIRIKGNGGDYKIRMHNQIMNSPKGLEVDHLDHNGLNNQRMNLRICTRQQNSCNKKSSGTSKYLGVCYFIDNRWKNPYMNIKATIHVGIRTIHLGYFETEEEAAHAYDNAAKEYFGEFANLNFKP